MGKDQLVEHGTAAPAVVRGPAEGQPAVAAKLPDNLAVRLAVAVVPSGVGQAAAKLGGHQVGEVVPQLAAELLLLGGIGQGHPVSIAVSGGINRTCSRSVTEES